MILSNVNIGTGPSAGDGDPIRSAFSLINDNFQTVTNNVNALTNSVTAATLIIDQGATAYKISNIQINGVNQTIRWVSVTPHTGTASNTDIVSFSLIYLGSSTYRVLGQSSSYG